MSELTDSGHKHGKIKESKCHGQFVFEKIDSRRAIPLLVRDPGAERSPGSAGAGHGAYK